MTAQGIPLHEEERCRNAVASFRAALSAVARTGRYPGRERVAATRDLMFALRRYGAAEVDPDDVLDSMISGGLCVERKGRIIPAARAKRRTSEERIEAFEAFVTNVAERACDDPDGRAALQSLIRRMTRLNWAHRVETQRGPGVLIPTKLAFVARQPAVTEGLAVILLSDTIIALNVLGDRIKTDWQGDHPVLSVDISGLRQVKSIGQAVMSMRLVGGGEILPLSRAAHSSAKALRGLVQNREAIETYIGVSLEASRWRGLSMSLGRPPNKQGIARRILVALLDPDLRRIALRNPFATYDFYFWLKKAGPETQLRRAQMSDAFPVFTAWLEELDDTVRDGQPLLPALERFSCLTIPHLRRLRGVHWQRLGGAVRNLIGDSDIEEGPNRDLLLVHPDRLPSNRKEWACFSKLSSWSPVDLRGDERRAFFSAASSNWVGYAELVDKDFGQALYDAASQLLTVVDHRLSGGMREGVVATATTRKLFMRLAGPNFGLKRLRRFNEAWHKGVGPRVMALRQLRRTAFGEERAASWKPLTKGDFICDYGRLVWLTDEDQLAVEGTVMSHCVGSYWARCISGESHIAQVHASDGARSTVEFGVDGQGKVILAQHHARFDSRPSASCDAVVDAYMSKSRKTKFEIGKGERRVHFDTTYVTNVDPNVAAAVREAYADCLSEQDLIWFDDLGRRWRGAYPELPLESVKGYRRDVGEILGALGL